MRWLFFLSNTLHADLRQLFYAGQYVGDDAVRQQRYRLGAQARLSAHLTLLNNQYQLVDGSYLWGDDPTLVDIYLAVCLRWLQLYPLCDRGWFTLADYTYLLKMAGALQAREPVINACRFEGITGAFFTQSQDAAPSAGSAL
ncbi:MAG: glutathione S-transferase C-terminal domain-containing protein [Pseudomonadota bacterium]